MRYLQDQVVNTDYPIMAVALTETWWDGRVADAEVTIPGYSLYRSDREFRTGGGSALFINSSLIVTRTLTWGDEYNNVTAVYISSGHTVIASIYRTGPYQELLNKLQDFIDEISNDTTTPDLFIMGDLNLPGFEWELEGVSDRNGSDQTAIATENFVQGNFLTQVVEDPTREANVLDVVLTNRPDYFIYTAVESTNVLSDHRTVAGVLGYDLMTSHSECRLPESNPWSFESFSYHKADFDSMKDHFSLIDWDELFEECKSIENTDTITAFSHLITLTVLQVTCIHSSRKGSFSGRPPKDRKLHHLKSKLRRINRRVRKMRKAGAGATRIRKLEESAQEWVGKIKCYLTNQINEEEDMAVSKIKENPKYFFSFAKRKKKVRSTVGPLEEADGTITNDPVRIAERLQDQYVQVFSDPGNVDVEVAVANIEDAVQTIEDFPFSPADMEDVLKELNPNSSGPQGDIPARILSDCRTELAYPLWKLWDLSFERGEIPLDLKRQQITPLFKKGNRSQPENYRPVALTPHVTKSFERVVRRHLTAFMESTGVLNDEQHGFRAGRSTLTQLLHHYDSILEDLNSGKEVDVAYIDYAKAFDKVDIKVLLRKLDKYGVRGKLYRWIEAFLTGRMQTVVVDGFRSRPESVISSVIQGSVIGPLLFIIYIADLVSVTSGGTLTFADDTKLRKAIGSLADRDQLQRDLDNIAVWSERNNMSLHCHKFELINYTLNNTKLLRELPMNAECYQYFSSTGEEIDPARCVKDLGIHMSNDGTWSTHICKISNEAKRLAGWALGVFRDRSQSTMMTLYKSLVRPKLEYCSPLWSPTKIGDIQKLEGIQRFFTRRIEECKGLNYWERLEKLKLMSLQRRRERYMVIQMWKVYRGLVPNSTGTTFADHPRHGPIANLPRLITYAQKSQQTLRENSFSVKAAKLFNRMPITVRTCSDLAVLKVELGNFLNGIPDCPPVRGYACPRDNSLLVVLT